jgi:hypothetical protein
MSHSPVTHFPLSHFSSSHGIVPPPDVAPVRQPVLLKLWPPHALPGRYGAHRFLMYSAPTASRGRLFSPAPMTSARLLIFRALTVSPHASVLSPVFRASQRRADPSERKEERCCRRPQPLRPRQPSMTRGQITASYSSPITR